MAVWRLSAGRRKARWSRRGMAVAQASPQANLDPPPSTPVHRLGEQVFDTGAAIALISCHRGFNSSAGAEGVGKAATEAFVFSFIAILFLDFVLGLSWNTVYRSIWPQAQGLI